MDTHATPEEVRVAVEALTDGDYARLMIAARSWVRMRLGPNAHAVAVQADDLLHDAILKSLDGRRRWNAAIPFLRHIDSIMESDSGHLVEKHTRFPTTSIPEHEDELPALDGNPLDAVLAKEELREVLVLFEGDDTAARLLHLRTQGYGASEIREELGMDKREYDTVTKRIRRRLAAHFIRGD